VGLFIGAEGDGVGSDAKRGWGRTLRRIIGAAIGLVLGYLVADWLFGASVLR